MTTAHDETATDEHNRDDGFIAIVVLVAGISVWLLLLPFVKPIAETTLHRFHLRTGTFWQWAIQQPIPSMYNFANRYEVTVTDPDTGEVNVNEAATVNHFPVRILTFANGRYRSLRERRPCDLKVTSSYRGIELETRFHVDRIDETTFRMSRIHAVEDDR